MELPVYPAISGVRFSALPPVPIQSEVFMVWNARKMPTILPELIAELKTSAR